MDEEQVRRLAVEAGRQQRKQRPRTRRADEVVRDGYRSHLRTLVPVRGSDPFFLINVVCFSLYEFLAGFWHCVDLVAFNVMGLAAVYAFKRWKEVDFEPHVTLIVFFAVWYTAFFFAGWREYYREPPPFPEPTYGEVHVGLGPWARAILVPHRDRHGF